MAELIIPLVDLRAQYHSIRKEIDNALAEAISGSDFIKGRAVTQFEESFSNYIGTRHCVGCGNGTDALELIIKSLHIGAGDEVIVPALTWIASAEAVNNAGAEPVFADIRNDDFTIDAEQIDRFITKRTKAIIAVHLYGCPCDMDLIRKKAEKYGLFVIEDCAQAHGAEFKGKKVGTFGIAAAFSFFPSKNLGAFGDAGAVVTDSDELADKVRSLANHGQLHVRHYHRVIGRNSRLDTIQAAVLNVKLKYLDDWNDKRIAASDYYRSGLGSAASVIVPPAVQNRKHVYHIFSILSSGRDGLIERLKSNGIASGIHYPTPLPFLEAYRYKQHSPDDFPVASRIANEVLSVPIYPEITVSQLVRVCEAITGR
jgi:dTDP-4-amino-4,6-dideoxygalactose transaminase